MKPINHVWVEKYRPKKIDDVVGSVRDKIKNYLKEPLQMPHLLFHSISPGTGKSTMASVIINELGADVLNLNSSIDRKIETIREKVNAFVQTKSSVVGTRRIVFMDEADGLNKYAQDALRNLMETYASNALFILTCNSLSSIIAPVQDRCVDINFIEPDKTEILNYLIKICNLENLEYTEIGLNKIINKNYPSIRACVKTLQMLHTEGKSITDNLEDTDIDNEFEELWIKISIDKDWKYVKEYIFKHPLNIKNLNKYFWYKAVKQSHIKLIQITALNDDKFGRGGEHIIIFVSSLIEMSK